MIKKDIAIKIIMITLAVLSLLTFGNILSASIATITPRWFEVVTLVISGITLMGLVVAAFCIIASRNDQNKD